MRPGIWAPPVEPSTAEQTVIRLVRRAKLFVFLRRYRHELFDEAFQTELAEVYRDSPKGQPPVPPAQLALALILQAYTGISDDEVIEATVMDRRWQLVLDCLDTDRPPFAKGTLVGFRTRLINAGWDRRLIARTIEIAMVSGGFGPRALRAALDSSPLWGAGRVEDTPNMGHALRKALGVIAAGQGWGLDEGTAVLARRAGAPVLAGSSLKAALDADWDDPGERDHALAVVLAALEAVETFIAAQPAPVGAAVAVARQVRDQDVETTPAGVARLRRGVAKNLTELHIDRAYLPSTLVRDRDENLQVFCKAWRVRNTTGRYDETAFTLNFDHGQLTCPAGVVMPFTPGRTVRFPAATCAACPLREQCTTSTRGRSVSIHPDETLLAELRERQATPAGRARLRERTAVEHTLAHVGHWQGRRARYHGQRKNLFYLRRTAVVHNLHVIARQRNDQQAA